MAGKSKDIVQKDSTSVIQKNAEIVPQENTRNKDVQGKYILFSGTKDSRTIQLNPENTYFKVTKVEVRSISREHQIGLYGNPLSISCKINISDIKSRTEILHEVTNYSFQNNNQTIQINKIISSESENTSIEITYSCMDSFPAEVYLHYTTTDKSVDLKNPFEEFSDHIKLKDNIKILFSAPFGQGKTTFLNHFFEENEIKYEVFKLYPVNYAVSHNEDIFKYIKAEILFQLMEKDVEFDKLEFNYSDAAYSYFSQNIDKIISPLLSLLPKVGETAAKVFDKIYELSQAVKKHKKELDINDEKAALKYIHGLYEKEGSIFEDNFYTQLIRQLLEQLKQKYNKQNVLIIDDIDRMDPDHIFRIFNVFSANFDSSEYRIGLSNKFGFDKIVLICDYDNIKKLFRHRYGSSSAFDGYLGKYYSRTPFYYDNTKAIERYTNNIVYRTGKEVSTLDEALLFVLNDLTTTGEITLRDLIKLKKFDFHHTVNKLADLTSKRLKNQMHSFLFFNVIAFLENIYDLDTIKEKIIKCKSEIKYKERPNYNYYTQVALVPLANLGTANTPRKNISYLDKSISFVLQNDTDHTIRYNYLKATDLKDITGNSTLDFNEKDFYEVLLINVDKYKET